MSSPIFGQLETSLADYLTDISGRARHGDDRAAADVARSELPKLIEALLGVLDEHSPDSTGRCTNCRPGRFSRTPAPCRAYLTAHLCLVDVTDEAPEATVPLRRPAIAGPGRHAVVRVSG
ncbi:hypothetical protein [Actinophytocola sediminis]